MGGYQRGLLLLTAQIPLAFAALFNLSIAATGRLQGKLYPNDQYGTMADDSMVNATTGVTSASSSSSVYGGPAKVRTRTYVCALW